MPNENDKNPAERRQFLRGAAFAAAGLAVGPALAQNDQPRRGAAESHQHTPAAAPARSDKPKIAMLVHPKLVLQDLVGPLTVFNLMQPEIHLVWKTRESVPTEVGIPIHPSTTFADCPADLDILCVPGGLEGTIACMDDSEVIDFLADRGARAKYVTSVCTGALLLGAAGLLKGYKATSHWYVRDQLALFGATPVSERVVHDRNRITGGGVTAGIDFGLTLASMIRSQADAERFQLVIEYAPQPPFNAGTPETAPKAIYERVAAGRAPLIDQARQKAEAIASRWRAG